MRLLLDANIVIWLLETPERISAGAMKALLNPDNQLFVSTATLMEIAAKASTGRLIFDDESRRKTELVARWMVVTRTMPGESERFRPSTRTLLIGSSSLRP